MKKIWSHDAATKLATTHVLVLAMCCSVMARDEECSVDCQSGGIETSAEYISLRELFEGPVFAVVQMHHSMMHVVYYSFQSHCLYSCSHTIHTRLGNWGENWSPKYFSMCSLFLHVFTDCALFVFCMVSESELFN